MEYIPTAAADFGYHRDQSVVFLLNQLIEPYFTFEFHTNSPIEHYCGNTQKCSVEWKMKVRAIRPRCRKYSDHSLVCFFRRGKGKTILTKGFAFSKI